MSPQAEHDVNGVTGDWHQFKKQLAAALLCAVYSFIVAFALMKGLMVVICVEIKILRRVRAESSRRPPRHRRDACSMAWRCRFLAARPSQDGRVIAEK